MSVEETTITPNVSIEISMKEHHRIIAAELIKKRKECNNEKLEESIDLVLLSYYMSPEEHMAALSE